MIERSYMNNEILEILQEECAEVIQAVSKVKRFGWDNSFGGTPDNRSHLEEEIGDLEAMIELLKKSKEISSLAVEKAKFNKLEKLKKWSNIKV